MSNQGTPIIDLHIDSFIWTRLLGYDIFKRHGLGPLRGNFLGQVDLPRLKDAGITGAMWSITTNPFRTKSGRARAFRQNFTRFVNLIRKNPDELKLIGSYSDLDPSKLGNRHAVWLSVQGGNALDHDLKEISEYAPYLTRITLMHLTHSRLGTSSTPYPSFKKRGLTKLGRDFVESLNRHRIFVDLAHADPQTFQDVVSIHDKSIPFLVTHTGVKGIHEHWRNISDEQIKWVAQTGGVIGVLYHSRYLGPSRNDDKNESILLHLEHIHKIAGEDFTALGSDWDGMIVPDQNLRDCGRFPELIQHMEKRGWSVTKIEKTLGFNFLRAFKNLRPN